MASPPPAPALRVLVFSGSMREGSWNHLLAELATKSAKENGAIVDLASMRDFEVPAYDGDLEASQGIPAGAQALQRRLKASDAFIIASPEYNASMPGLLKNLIDWTSRFRPQPFDGKHALLLSASPSLAGGNRGLWALRMPLEPLGSRVYPDMFSLAQAHQAFDPQGEIANPQLADRLDQTIAGFMDLAEAAKHYPCAKAAWIEFLGEHPDSPIDRVDKPPQS